MYTEEDRRIATDILMELKRSHLVEESDMYDRMNHYYKMPVIRLALRRNVVSFGAKWKVWA